MNAGLVAVQLLNGLQLGVLLFLVAAGLTLVFGIMDVINLAHGVLYMIGAYTAAVVITVTGSFWLGLLSALPVAAACGLLLDRLVIRPLHGRDHLDQVLATFGGVFFVDELVRLILGPAPQSFPVPDWLDFGVTLPGGTTYPAWRLGIIGAGLATALGLFLAIDRTRFGMLVRAGASDPLMLQSLGVDIRQLFMAVMGLGAMLAGFAGVMAGPIVSVQPGMGDGVLILAFVVIVTGGTGSIQGALAGSLLVGLVDTLGRSFLTDILRLFLTPSVANTVGPAIASMAIYLTMALVLLIRPQGLVPARGMAR